jgi:hypothetical protein
MFFMMSCGGPTYPQQSAAESLKQLLKKETGVDSDVFIVGNTIYLDMQIDGLLSIEEQDFKSSQEVFSAAVSNITRVVLSGDSQIKYMTVNAYPPEQNLLYRHIQNIDDFKAFYYGRISRDDYFSRNVLEIKSGKENVRKILSDKSEITQDSFAAMLIVSEVDNLVYKNPFLGTVINSLSLSYGGIENGTLIINTKASKMDSETKMILENALLKSARNFLKKYDTSIKKIEVLDVSGRLSLSLNV